MKESLKEYIIPMDPFPAPRMSRRDRFRPSPSAQRFYGNRDEMRAHLSTLGISELPPAMGFSFHIPVSKSWSNAKKELHIGGMHQMKPDLDNLIKAVLDSITYGKGRDDAHLGSILFAQKVWATEGAGRIMLYVPDDSDPQWKNMVRKWMGV